MERRELGFRMWMYCVLLAAALGVLGWGIYLMARTPADRMVFSAGCVSVIAVLLVWLFSLELRSVRREEAARTEALFAPVNERLQYMSLLLNQVSEQQLISERAKAIAFRENERDALRRAIHEETARKDWEAALVLANEIEAVFGYKQEADGLRKQIADLREADVRRQVNDGLAVIDRHCRAEQWTLALREAERLMQLFPHDGQSQRLPQEIETRRHSHKKQLLDGFHDSVARHDVDGGIEILKSLDSYLTPAEAESMQETARQIFKDKRLILGQQFAVAVREHRWSEAIRLGEAITAEFPNSRMAQEVQEKMELLRQRATETEPAKV